MVKNLQDLEDVQMELAAEKLRNKANQEQLAAEKARNDANDARFKRIEMDLANRGTGEAHLKTIGATGEPRPRAEVEAWLAKPLSETVFFSKTPGHALMNLVPAHEITDQFGRKTTFPGLDVAFRQYRGVGTELIDPHDDYNRLPLIKWGEVDIALIKGVVDKPKEECVPGEFSKAMILELMQRVVQNNPDTIFTGAMAQALLRQEYGIAYAEQDRRNAIAAIRGGALPGSLKMGQALTSTL